MADPTARSEQEDEQVLEQRVPEEVTSAPLFDALLAVGSDPGLAHEAVESVRNMAGENLLRGLETKIERLQGAVEAQGATLEAKLETHARSLTAALEAQAKSQSAALESLEAKLEAQAKSQSAALEAQTKSQSAALKSLEAQIKSLENSVQSSLLAYAHEFKIHRWALGGIVAVGIAMLGFVLQGARSVPIPADPPTPPISSPSETSTPTAKEDPPVPTVLDDVGNTSVANR